MESCFRANTWTIDLRVVVVMPDHVHMIFTPLIDIDEVRGVFAGADHEKVSKELQRI